MRQFTIYICISCQKKREFDNIIDNVPCVVVLQEEKKKGFVSDDSEIIFKHQYLPAQQPIVFYIVTEKKIFKELRYNSSIIGVIFFQHDGVDKKSLAVY